MTTTSSAISEDHALWTRPWTIAEEEGAAAMVTVSEQMMSRPDHVFSGLYSRMVEAGNVPPYDTVITSVMETASIRSRASRQLQEAVSMMPFRDTVDLLMALAHAPELVRIESDPMRYLRCENYNPWAAASSLTGYWRLRRELFGDKAFRPLALTGESALDPECIASILNGSFRILPRDATRRTILMADTSRRLHHSPATRLKSCFFFLTVVSENPISQTDGFVYLVADASSPKLDHVLSTQWRMVAQFPLRTPQICFCYCVPQSSHQFFSVVINTYVRLGLTKFLMNNKVVQHVRNSKDEMVQQLELMGITKESIPITLGGNFGLEDHARWFLERCLARQASQQNVAEQRPSQQQLKSLLYQNCMKLVPLAMNEIPANRKAAYLRAMEHAPEVVDKESNMHDLLSAEDYHVANACRRMVEYWELRCQLFGARAVLALNQTGEGALDRSDWAVLRTGFVMVLPNDVNGLSVVVMNPSLLNDNDATDRPSVYRCIFYILSVAAENPTASTKGIVILFHAPGTGRSKIKIDRLRAIILALPIQVAAVHTSGEIRESGSAWIEGLNFGWKPKIHDTTATTRLMSVLQPYGLPLSSLPASYGGTWQMSNYTQWQELRIRAEWDLPIRTSLGHGYPGLQPRVRSTASSESERKRRMEVVFAHRRRNQIRLQTGLLQEEVLQLRVQKDVLLHEQQRLEGLIKTAGSLISKHQS